MSVLIETSVGELTIDLFVDECPYACKNFLKLCKLKYYHGCLFFNVQQDFMVQVGDPTATGRGGSSANGVLYGEQARFFDDELDKSLRHDRRGMVAYANTGPNTNASCFYITTSVQPGELDHLDDKHVIFGEVAEGLEVLQTINDEYCDSAGRPMRDVRIKHTRVLEDPYPDPPQLVEPPSPTRARPEAEAVPTRIAADAPTDDDGVGADAGRSAQREKEAREKEAKSRSVVLEMIGDLPDADVKPPEDTLFVAKLNPITTDDDLALIFSRFGAIVKCEIMRDWRTGDSLCFGFVEFERQEDCEEAFTKMDNVLIDDRRIKVDFSQSVARLWNSYRRGERQGGKGSGGKGSGGKGSGGKGGGKGSGGKGGNMGDQRAFGAPAEARSGRGSRWGAPLAAAPPHGGAATAPSPPPPSSSTSRWGPPRGAAQGRPEAGGSGGGCSGSGGSDRDRGCGQDREREHDRGRGWVDDRDRRSDDRRDSGDRRRNRSRSRSPRRHGGSGRHDARDQRRSHSRSRSRSPRGRVQHNNRGWRYDDDRDHRRSRSPHRRRHMDRDRDRREIRRESDRGYKRR